MWHAATKTRASVRDASEGPPAAADGTIGPFSRMAIPPVTRLGPYEIVAEIGAGGMGTVYRARDTTLGRDVAIRRCPRSSRAILLVG